LPVIFCAEKFRIKTEVYKDQIDENIEKKKKNKEEELNKKRSISVLNRNYFYINKSIKR